MTKFLLDIAFVCFLIVGIVSFLSGEVTDGLLAAILLVLMSTLMVNDKRRADRYEI